MGCVIDLSDDRCDACMYILTTCNNNFLFPYNNNNNNIDMIDFHVYICTLAHPPCICHRSQWPSRWAMLRTSVLGSLDPFCRSRTSSCNSASSLIDKLSEPPWANKFFL